MSDRDTQLPTDMQRVVDKLTKINAALMRRVERSMDQQANAFSLFQTAINQETQIRVRTEELNNALSKLAEANLELSTARDDAERANRFKTRFFTAVGHDLLQPLHAARLMLSELIYSAQSEDNKRLATTISSALTIIEELLTSILDISKLEAGVYVPNMQPVALNHIFDQLVANLEPVARKKGLKLRCHPTDLGVRSDPLMLKRMIQNLVANAINYTTTGSVLLDARTRGDVVTIEVWDTGPGIPPQERQRIFDEFQRGAASERAGGHGFGLGLTIVRRMAETLGHELNLESRLGHGSRFTITAIRELVAASEPNAPLVVPEQAAIDSFYGQQILVIDNDLNVLEAMHMLLTRWGADARIARDIEDISEILSDKSFDPVIILADYHLDNGATGIEAIAHIRDQLEKRTPAILITADRTPATSDVANNCGCEVLHKPVKPAELRALMQHMIQA